MTIMTTEELHALKDSLILKSPHWDTLKQYMLDEGFDVNKGAIAVLPASRSYTNANTPDFIHISALVTDMYFINVPPLGRSWEII